ncbi:MAG: STAS domain-containing protein [Planctomycetes bacterium]|nr:STAS domain-containing protein [Planctomycetota bacterium]
MAQLRMDWVPLEGVPRIARVALSGAIDADTVYTFEDKMKEMQQAGFDFYAFDMAEIKYCNCTGLGSLVATADNLGKVGGCLVMFNLNPKVTVVFEMLGLNSFFHIVPDEQEALSIIRKRRAPRGGGGVVAARDACTDFAVPQPAHLELATCCAGALAQCALCGDICEGDLPLLWRRYNLIRTPHLRFFIIDCSKLRSLDAHAQRWLVNLSGELVAKGGCAALVGLKPELRQQLRDHDAEMAFEHYDVLSAARASLERVLAKQPAYVHDIHRHDGLLAVTISFGASLPNTAEQQVARNLEETLRSLPWLKHLVLDLSRVRTMAPEVELQLNKAAEIMKQRGGETLVAGAPAAVHAGLQQNAGTLFRFYSDAEGARHEIENEFLSG